MIRLNKRELLFIAYFYNNAIYVGSTIFIKVTVAFPSANQKCNALYIYIYIYIYNPFSVDEILRLSAQKYTDFRFLRRECQGILQEGWSQRYNEAISNFHYSSNCIK